MNVCFGWFIVDLWVVGAMCARTWGVRADVPPSVACCFAASLHCCALAFATYMCAFCVWRVAL